MAIDFTDVTTGELVETYNSLAEALGHKPVSRFADRKTAEERTRRALSMIDPSKRPGRWCEAEEPPKPKPTPVEVAAEATEAAIKKVEDLKTADQTPTPAVAPTLPIPSDNPTKDREMPAIRRAVRLVELKPKSRVYARKEGSKQSILVDMLSRPEGATFGELYDALNNGQGKPWQGVTIRSGLAWDMNNVAGYGITSTAHNGEDFHKMGRTYEANRLGFGTNAYDPDIKLLVYRLAYPRGMTEPLPHTPRPKKPTPEQVAAAKAATEAALQEAASGKKG